MYQKLPQTTNNGQKQVILHQILYHQTLYQSVHRKYNQCESDRCINCLNCLKILTCNYSQYQNSKRINDIRISKQLIDFL